MGWPCGLPFIYDTVVASKEPYRRLALLQIHFVSEEQQQKTHEKKARQSTEERRRKENQTIQGGLGQLRRHIIISRAKQLKQEQHQNGIPCGSGQLAFARRRRTNNVKISFITYTSQQNGRDEEDDDDDNTEKESPRDV